jgi:hypothetical protein
VQAGTSFLRCSPGARVSQGLLGKETRRGAAVNPAAAADLDQRRQLMVVPDQDEHAGTLQGTQASLHPGERRKREGH